MKNVGMFACVQGRVSMRTTQARADVFLSVLGCVRALTCAGALLGGQVVGDRGQALVPVSR
jgi:hypothetical protein